MVLDYVALVILIMGLTFTFYTFIYIHDLPYKIAKKRNHPHTEAIHVACWLSLFTLHAIWPFVYIWAVTHRKDGTAAPLYSTADGEARVQIVSLEARLKQLETALHSAVPPAAPPAVPAATPPAI